MSVEKFTTAYAYPDEVERGRMLESRTVAKELGKGVPPNNIEVEQLVLGALILERDAFPIVGEILTPDCFYDTKHRYIFEAIRQLALEEKPIDAQMVIEQLRLNDKLTATNGLVYISQLSTLVNSTAHLEYHARLLFDKKLQRDLISFGNEVISNSFDPTILVTDTMQDAEQRLFEITQGRDGNEVQAVGDLVPTAVQKMQDIVNGEVTNHGVRSGFPEIDEITFGWHPTDLVIIAARPAMGKTAFVLSMARNMAVEHQAAVAIFSLEMSKEQLINRLIVNHTEIPNDDIKRGSLSPQQLQILDQRIGTLEQAPLFIDDTAGLSVFDLRSKARRLVRQYDVKVIIIDYLQLMTASGLKSNANREQEVSTISRSLKQLAKELNITVIALSQLNRGVENRPKEGKRPQLSDLRESGAIEQDADMVCFIHRPEYYGILEDEDGRSMKDMGEFIIAKHRNGRVDTVLLRFQSSIIKFASAQGLAQSNNTGRFTSKMNQVGTSTPQGADPLMDSAPDSGFSV
ncbi:replicative DNA helicase [Porphyromonas levii]|uniref:replicative DNA helicase n=1 Tax=Porphyromonas levii TaxID=28114 RepID=UPI001BADFFBA|nr:replicative DNA helicase [Porphyromonas levii]MBR8703715.1 Replicative DNA helicase [Porphyromonas levii]MBR8784710.1 Replicative DNA helicase [Porphyromonas levii]